MENPHLSGSKFFAATMNYLIWYNPKNGNYVHGTEMDFHVHQSLTGEEMTILYELEESEIFLVKKIVAQLNAARSEQNSRKAVMVR